MKRPDAVLGCSRAHRIGARRSWPDHRRHHLPARVSSYSAALKLWDGVGDNATGAA